MISSNFTASNLRPNNQEISYGAELELAKLADSSSADLISNGLQLDFSEQPTVLQMGISEIIAPVAFTRLDQNDNYDDIESIDNLEPVKVAKINGLSGHFLVDGQRRLQFQKEKGKKKINVIVVGDAVCQSQVAMARAVEMTKFKKPMTTLELSLGLLRLRQLLMTEFGEKHFYDHGGDRKDDFESKQSLPVFIAQSLGLAQTTVATLLNFGRELGEEALVGLQDIRDMATLSIRTINQINAQVKESKLSERIQECMEEMRNKDASNKDIICAAGQMASENITQIIHDKAKSPNPPEKFPELEKETEDHENKETHDESEGHISGITFKMSVTDNEDDPSFQENKKPPEPVKKIVQNGDDGKPVQEESDEPYAPSLTGSTLVSILRNRPVQSSS